MMAAMILAVEEHQLAIEQDSAEEQQRIVREKMIMEQDRAYQESLAQDKQKVVCSRDLQYISISQYIDTLVEYRIVIRCSMNIEISDSAEQCMFHVVNITLLSNK